jgi:hypothetical protein
MLRDEVEPDLETPPFEMLEYYNETVTNDDGTTSTRRSPRMIRNPRYPGESGLTIWKTDLNDNRARTNRRELECGKIMSILIRSCEDSVRAKVEQRNGYEAAIGSNDIIWMWQNIRFVCSGQGAHLIVVDISKFMGLKASIVADYSKWAVYLREFDETARKILDRIGPTLSAEDLLKQFINAWFVITMRGHPKLKEEMRTVMLQETWPDYREFSEKITRVLTIVETLDIKTEDFAFILMMLLAFVFCMYIYLYLYYLFV